MGHAFLHSFRARFATFPGLAPKLLLGGLFVGALAIRCVELDNPVLAFAATRQYRSAIIARALFYAMAPWIPEAKRIVAAQANRSQGRLEPPITEAITALGYRIAGSEQIAIPHLLTTSFWLVGAFCLYRCARRLQLGASAFVALAYVLFQAFGVIASRSFQPDPLLIMSICASLYAILEDDFAPAPRRLALAAATTGFAMLVKPVAAFFLLPVFAALCIRRAFPLRWLASYRPWVFGAIALLPTALYYLPGLIGGGAIAGQAQTSFLPQMWHSHGFWLDWLRKIDFVLGRPALYAALLGSLLAPTPLARLVLFMLWLGYFAYGVTFTRHISSHDYYQLPLILIVGLAWAALCERAFGFLRRFDPGWRWAVALAGSCLFGYLALTSIRDRALPMLQRRNDAGIAMYKQVGEVVHHSNKVVFLSPDSYGGPMQYFGEIAGWNWPTLLDQKRARKRGYPFGDPLANLAEKRAAGAEYFVATSKRELHRQRVLSDYLYKSFQCVRRTDDYVVYDLVHKRP